MNTRITVLINLLFILFVFAACQETTGTEQKEIASTTMMNKTEKKEKLLRHVVIFKFKDEASEEDVDRLNESFNALADATPVIKDFEWGINASPEDFHQDFTHCLRCERL